MRCATVLSGAAVSAPAPELVVFAPTAVAAGCASGRLAAAVAVSEPPDWLRVVVELAAVSQAARISPSIPTSTSMVTFRGGVRIDHLSFDYAIYRHIMAPCHCLFPCPHLC